MKKSKNRGFAPRALLRWADHHNLQANGPTALHTAAFKGDVGSVNALLKTGIDVNSTDAQGWTPLHDAVNQGHKEIVEILIAAGADINAQDTQMLYTPLHDATRMEYPAITTLLIAAGADTTLKAKGGQTAADIEKEREAKK